MSNSSDTTTDARPGSSPSLVQFFSIEGLYGYRTISLSSDFAATILIARNGAGKTTLLGALDAFLRGEFTRLSNLQFSRIRCKLRGIDEELVLDWHDVQSLFELREDSEIYSVARRCNLDPAVLLEYILTEYQSSRRSHGELHESEVFSKVFSTYGHSTAEARRVCDKLIDSARGPNTNLQHIYAALKQAIGDTEIVYLPTYRRIELPLSDDRSKEDRMRGRRRPSIQSRLGLSKRGLYKTDIQFGLADISERLSDLNQEILFNSNQGYREISANIINELLDGTFDDREENRADDKPDRESLLLFFSRVKEGRQFVGPHRDRDFRIPDIDRVYNEGASSDTSNKFLQYFLSKLNTVIQATRSIEGLVQEFIDHCNTYLSAQDPTTLVGKQHPSADGKQLKLDRKTLKVHVESLAAQRKIPLDSLSSGEKQMISLFARLYLYAGPKILLIDEPELSLSIDWQRKILIDVVSAPTCSQVIAITHSPFVFENELEPFAQSVKLHVNLEAQPSAEDEAEDDVE